MLVPCLFAFILWFDAVAELVAPQPKETPSIPKLEHVRGQPSHGEVPRKPYAADAQARARTVDPSDTVSRFFQPWHQEEPWNYYR